MSTPVIIVGLFMLVWGTVTENDSPIIPGCSLIISALTAKKFQKDKEVQRSVDECYPKNYL